MRERWIVRLCEGDKAKTVRQAMELLLAGDSSNITDVNWYLSKGGNEQ